MMKVHKDVVGTVGNTPLVRINHLLEAGEARLFAKLEGFNPLSSVKDRTATAMIEAAERNGDLKPGGVIVEPTSGNTGIALAFISAARGYRLVLTMPDTMSIERRKLLAFLGAEVLLTPGELGMKGAVEKAGELARETTGAFMPDQFRNPANPEVHRLTTAEEILRDLGGPPDALVAGIGTGGTITGIARAFRERSYEVKVFGVEPAASAVLSGGRPGAHSIQGIGAGFVPEILDLDMIDEIVPVKDQDAAKTVRSLARQEGIFAGISSGAAMWAALEIARSEKPEINDIVVILPDAGDRYLSTPAFQP